VAKELEDEDNFSHLESPHADQKDETNSQSKPLMDSVEKRARGSLNKEERPEHSEETEFVANELRESVFSAEGNDMSFCGRLKVLMSNSCFVYLTLAGALRFFGGYSLGFLSGGFFEERYPDNKDQFAYMNTVVVVGGGVPASFLGGYIGDRLEKKIGSIKGLISGVGALCAVPFIIIAYGVQPGFWGSIISYYFAYLIAEMWYGPAHAQINNMFPSEYQGFAVAFFNLCGAIAGSIATLILGALKTKYDDPNDDEKSAETNGIILMAGVLFSYCTCGPLFILSGMKYSNQLEKNKAEIKRRALEKKAEKTVEMSKTE